MALSNAQLQARWRTRRAAEKAHVAERLRTMANVVANADIVPEELPNVAQEMIRLAETLEGKCDKLPHPIVAPNEPR